MSDGMHWAIKPSRASARMVSTSHTSVAIATSLQGSPSSSSPRMARTASLSPTVQTISCLPHIRKAAAVIAGAQVLLLQLETPLETVAAAAQLGAAKGARVILNPAPARPLPDALLRHVSILTPNETEAGLLTGVKMTGIAAAGKAARILMGRGVSTIVITLGAKGALIANEQGTCVVPAFEVKPVDSTAAGDIFNGALAVALAEGEPLIAAVRMANAAAALSVMRSGAQPSAPTRQAIDAFMKRGEGADATGDAPMLPASRRRMRSVMSVATATFRRESRVPRPAPWKV